jgi:hypothetical protein
MKTRIRWWALGAVVAIGMASAVPVATAQGGDETPADTEVGVSADEISIEHVSGRPQGRRRRARLEAQPERGSKRDHQGV